MRRVIRAIRERIDRVFVDYYERQDDAIGPYDPFGEVREAMVADAATLEAAAAVLTDYGATRSADQLRAWSTRIRFEAENANR